MRQRLVLIGLVLIVACGGTASPTTTTSSGNHHHHRSERHDRVSRRRARWVGGSLQLSLSVGGDLRRDRCRRGGGHGGWTVEVAEQKEPPAQIITFSSEGFGGESVSTEMVTVDGSAYSLIGGQCLPGMSPDAFAPPFDPDASFDSALSGAERLGTETVNGFEAVHYRFDPAVVELQSDSTVSLAEGWVSEDLGVVVRSTMTATGPYGGTEATTELNGDWQYTFDLLSANEPVEVAIPAGCTPTSAADSDFPVMEGATISSAEEGVLVYTINATAEEVFDFYTVELGSAGYTPNDGAVVAGAQAVTFSNGSEEVIVTVIAVAGQTLVSVASD